MQTKPEWLKIKVKNTANMMQMERLLEGLSLHTVCEEAACPNKHECYGKRTATFMILGRNCTRNCTFCNVDRKTPDRVNPEEPIGVAQAVQTLGLRHVVVTSVTRDDLPDGGADHFGQVIREIKKLNPNTTVEALIPDFGGSYDSLEKVAAAQPDIIGHNVETVPRLYPSVRAMANYARSLELLQRVKEFHIYSKSSIMLGLSETEEEVLQVFRDLRVVNCDFLTVGQYLAPSTRHHEVMEYITPAAFDRYRILALEMGFLHVSSGPLVRSSYHADEAMDSIVRESKD